MTIRAEGESNRVLYDGWALARQPNSPAAVHLLAILELHPAGFQALLALPSPTIHSLPEAVEVLEQPTADTPTSRLHWEQKILPGLAAVHHIRLLHQTAGSPPLWSKVPCLVSPAAFSPQGLFEQRRGQKLNWVERLRQAAGWGGLARNATLLWPEDLPLPELEAPARLLPGVVHPLFQPAQDGTGAAQEKFRLLSGEAFPETYILYHGPAGDADLARLFSAWNWANGSIGEYCPLILAGGAGRITAELVESFGLDENTRVMPELPVAALVALYQGCSLLFHPAEIAAWGNSVQMALACGKPVVAMDSPRCAALVGPAAYLAPDDANGRALGAALLSVVVEDNLATSLSEAALRRTAAMDASLYTSALGNIYRAII